MTAYWKCCSSRWLRGVTANVTKQQHSLCDSAAVRDARESLTSSAGQFSSLWGTRLFQSRVWVELSLHTFWQSFLNTNCFICRDMWRCEGGVEKGASWGKFPLLFKKRGTVKLRLSTSLVSRVKSIPESFRLESKSSLESLKKKNNPKVDWFTLTQQPVRRETDGRTLY